MAGITYPAFSGPVSDIGSVLTATGATTTLNTNDLYNSNFRGVKVSLNVTATSGTVTLTLQGKDSQSGQYYTILASAAVAAPGFSVYTVFPGAPVSANVSANDFLPSIWRVQVACTAASTFTVGAVLM